MAKSVVNEEFKAQRAALYAPHGFVPRAKGQRKPAEVLPLFLFQDDPGIIVRHLGTSPGYGDHGKVIDYDVLLVMVASAWVPAYRITSPDNRFNICQDFTFVRSVK